MGGAGRVDQQLVHLFRGVHSFDEMKTSVLILSFPRRKAAGGGGGNPLLQVPPNGASA